MTPLVPKLSTEERECKMKGCTNIAVHERKRCFKHQPRTRLEAFLDLHNHKMEFLRTFFGLMAFILQLVILAKVFDLI